MFAKPMYLINTDTVENGPLVNDFSDGTKNLIPIVFSHGYSGFCQLYTCLCRELASAGYIVFSMGHQDGSGIYTTDRDGNPIYTVGISNF
mmetsp:Transcript_110/g.109  ORF Transcript_110/g.109 Transcript_110/m.109 type:complete len:90 (+) Transcript_110:162-431(+)